MKIRYDPDADAVYIKLSDEKVETTREVDDNAILDYDERGRLIGIELLFVKERMPHLLKEIQVENLIAA